MADEIRVNYDQLRQVAARFSTRANATQQTQQRVQRSMNQLQPAWTGRGSQAFFAEMNGEVLPALQRLTEALRRAHDVTLQVSQVFQAAEDDAARPFRVPGDVSLLRPLIDGAQGVVDAVDEFGRVLSVSGAVLLALGLKAGATYPGQVIVRAPQLLRDLGISGKTLKELAGASGSLSHIGAANIATHVTKMAVRPILGISALIATGKGVIAVADVWERHSAEYAGYDPIRRGSAMGVDGGLATLPVATEFLGGAGGSVGGVWLGAKIGAMTGGTLGSIIPGVGTAVGAVAGGVVGGAIGGVTGGLAGDWLGRRAGDAAVSSVQSRVSRDQMIDYVDTKVARPVTNAVVAASEEVQSWFRPAAQLEYAGK